MPDIIANVADVTGILSFLLSIMLLIKSEALRKSIIYQKIDYKAQHQNMRAKIMAFNESLQEGDLISLKQIGELRQILYQCLLSFQYVLSYKDKRILKSTLHLLNKNIDAIDKTRLSTNLDYLIARFHKKEAS